MKLNCSNQKNRATTLFEVMVAVIVTALLVAIFLPTIHTGRSGPALQRISCINNLKQVGLAYRVWAGDNNDKYPMEISVTNGGTKELAVTGDLISTYQVMSNELSTPKILYCTADSKRSSTVFWGPSFNGTHISYFINLDANESASRCPISGDDHFQIGGIRMRPGLTEVSTNLNVGWTSERHQSEREHFWLPTPRRNGGNIGFVDGSAEQLDVDGLRQALGQTGLATNRFVMP